MPLPRNTSRPTALSAVHTSAVASIANPITISVGEKIRVSGLTQRPLHAIACLVLAHGAGGGMDHPFMAALARELAAIDIATGRFQFAYMERQGKRPDPPALCHATIRDRK